MSFLPAEMKVQNRAGSREPTFLFCFLNHSEVLGQSCHSWRILLKRLLTPIVRWVFNGKVLCKVEYVSLMHDSACLTNAGSETRSPKVICPNEIKPISLASIHLLCCLTPSWWCNLSFSYVQGCFWTSHQTQYKELRLVRNNEASDCVLIIS